MFQQRRSIKSGLANSRVVATRLNNERKLSHQTVQLVIWGTLAVIALGLLTLHQSSYISIVSQQTTSSHDILASTVGYAGLAAGQGLSPPLIATLPIVVQSSQTNYQPRIVQLDRIPDRVVSLDLTHPFKTLPEDDHVEIMYLHGDKNERLNANPICVPFGSWQTSAFLTCNNIHETDLEHLWILNCGSTRCVFQFTDMDGTVHILKINMFENADTILMDDELEDARRDTAAMERLTSSPFVLDVFNACGTSQMVENSDYGNLFDWIRLVRSGQRKKPTPLEKLKFGIQIASSVADMHSIDHNSNKLEGLVSLTHNDICCHQFIHVDGIFKLGDFQLCEFHSLNTTSHNTTTCTTLNKQMNSVLGKVRAPEELHGQHINSLEKIDVFLMANVMYYVLTQKWTFEGITTEEAEGRLERGLRPDIPEDTLVHPAEQVLIKAIQWSWSHVPMERPTARQVSEMLKLALLELEGGNLTSNKELDLRVPLPPLPVDYDFSEEEFYQNIGRWLS